MSADLLYGGDSCPVCGAELDYEEDRETGDIWLTHPDPGCGWMPSGYPSTRRGALDGRDPDDACWNCGTPYRSIPFMSGCDACEA